MSQSIAGASISLKLNGSKVAFLGNCNVTIEYTRTPINILDQLEVAEHALTAHVCSFTASFIKVDANTAISLGLESTDLDSLFAQGELTAELYDRVNDNVRAQISGVVFEGGSLTTEARGIMQGTWNFKGRIATGL
jgi:hypothetical protein